jgi:tripartite-type tricarboxylate transporter receptor subunit TctC
MTLLNSALVASLVLSSGAQAQPDPAYPSRPIHFVVAFPAGGAADNLARMLATEFSKDTGVAWVIDNKPGASAAIGSSFTLQSRPDGYTVMLSGFAPLITNRFTQKHLSYDPDKFTKIGMLTSTPNVLVTGTDAPFKTVPELIAYAKNHPGQLTFGSYGIGTTSQLNGELLKQAAGIDMLHVPYKGASQAIPALLGGQISVYFDAISATLPLVHEGKLRALAVTGAQRLSVLPNVPTIAESVTGYELQTWNGMVAAPNTPPYVVVRLNTMINRVLADPAVKKKLLEMGSEPVTGTPQDFERRVKLEIPRMQELVVKAGIEPE